MADKKKKKSETFLQVLGNLLIISGSTRNLDLRTPTITIVFDITFIAVMHT